LSPIDNEANVRSSMVEVLKLDGFSLIQKMDIGENILDVTFHENTMYVSLDAKGTAWIIECQDTPNGFKKVDAPRWTAPDTKTETKADLYWLESMRKKVGASEDD
jgi:hypothetical protein